MGQAVQQEQKRLVLKIGGMHCAGCAVSIQKYLSDVAGIANVDVSYASTRATIVFDPGKVSLQTIEKAVEEVGYRVAYEKVSFKIRGMSDTSDAALIERELKRIEGVKDALVNYGTQGVLVEYNSALVSLMDLRTTVSKLGYEVLSEELAAGEEELEAQRLKQLVIIGAVFTAPVLLWTMLAHIFMWIPLALTPISAVIAFASATVVQFLVGSRFYIGAWKTAKMKSANMDTLVVLGTTAAYVYSVFNTFPWPVWDNIYYDAAAVVITLVLLGKYLENKTKGKTSAAIKKLLELQPKRARLLRDGQEVEVPVETIQVGDLLLIRPGEKVPTDGVVAEGFSAVDESMVSGESVPVEKKPGDGVIGGTVNREGALKVKAAKIGGETFLAQVVGLVEEAMGRKPPVQRLVDKFAGYFAFMVIAIALATFSIWYFGIAPGHAARALIPAVAVLVVACPCALGLATPTAVSMGMGKGAQYGVIFKSGEALERTKKVSVVVFDKTGTLTEGKPKVTDVVSLNSVAEQEVIRLAAVAERNSEHPLARAVVNKAQELGLNVDEPQSFKALPGRGVRAVYGGKELLVGSMRLTEDKHVDISTAQESLSNMQANGRTTILVAYDGKLAGAVGLMDTPKPEASKAIELLKKMGIEIVMITGDNERTAQAIAKMLKVDRVLANVLPGEKASKVKELQEQGKVVAMVGDGVNDAPALSQADVGLAIGSGTDIAIESGSVVLVRDDLRDVVAALQTGRKTMSKIKQNLFWAFFYNILLIPMAASGLLYPTLAGLAMAMSSVSVTGSSLMMKRWKPPVKA
ncbi:MAG: heavy metal translocating P-type ATPase [Thaumarchaeota archaeon]|nr:heavy metal translocating P-type ATPase [Nitrososphaerota archaeon]